jgi:hypothetical protein
LFLFSIPCGAFCASPVPFAKETQMKVSVGFSNAADDDDTKPESWFPAPAEIQIVVGGKRHRLAYEKAFVLGCSLIEKGQAADAAKLFERLEQFGDRGPRAFIMQAFCEAAALHFEECSKPLAQVFTGEKQAIAGALHNAFISYHVGIRQDAINAMIELVNEHRDLPTLCLLLGDMMERANNLPMAGKCWSLAVHRDRPGGAVAAVAMQHLRKLTGEHSAVGKSN